MAHLSATALLKFIREHDPDAHLDSTTWGQTVLVTKAFDLPTLMLWNPDVTVISDARKKALT